jgi:RNA polymerase sigma-70 factor (ECF subfamily)
MTSEEVEGPSDEALVAEYRRDSHGDRGRRAVDALMRRWRGRVFLWAYRVMREREAALDVAQDALVQAYQALPRYEPRGRFSAWLFAIVHNRCITELRRRGPQIEPDDVLEALPSNEAGAPLAFERSEEMERVLEAMDDVLTPLERRALWLRAYEGMTVDDITRMLGIGSASGARGVLQNARLKLREALKERTRERRE